jgi:hypothetical protein
MLPVYNSMNIQLLFAAILCLCCFMSQQGNAQLQDDFSDGDFTTAPSWAGMNENFVVTNGELQLNDLAPVTTQSYLSVSSVLANLSNKEWRFRIRQSFSGSDSNQSRVYLTSDGSVLQYSGNGSAGVSGYFLKFGEGLSADVIRWQQHYFACFWNNEYLHLV